MIFFKWEKLITVCIFVTVGNMTLYFFLFSVMTLKEKNFFKYLILRKWIKIAERKT